MFGSTIGKEVAIGGGHKNMVIETRQKATVS